MIEEAFGPVAYVADFDEETPFLDTIDDTVALVEFSEDDRVWCDWVLFGSDFVDLVGQAWEFEEFEFLIWKVLPGGEGGTNEFRKLFERVWGIQSKESS